MNFSVSKIRFLINELFISILVAIICTILEKLLNGFVYISVYVWLGTFLYLCLKIDWYWQDELYIHNKSIRLQRTKVGGNSMKYGIWKDNSDYYIEKIENFIETPTKFIVYGDMQKKTVHLSDRHGGTETKRNKKRLVIRKNFKNTKKIRELLNAAVNSK